MVLKGIEKECVYIKGHDVRQISLPELYDDPSKTYVSFHKPLGIREHKLIKIHKIMT